VSGLTILVIDDEPQIRRVVRHALEDGDARVLEGATGRDGIEAGRPVDFLEQLDAAADALHQSLIGKARNLGRQVGGRAGIEREIKRARSVVDIIDTIVKAAFYDDEAVLAKWRNAKRVRARPGGTGVGSVGNEAAQSNACPDSAPVAVLQVA
jgi:hypothetical protein